MSTIKVSPKEALKSMELFKSVDKKQSELQVIKKQIGSSIDDELRSYSSAFNQLRKNHGKFAELLKEYAEKGKSIDEDLYQKVIVAGEIKHLKQYQTASEQDRMRWTGSQITNLAVRAMLNRKPKK